MIAIKIDFPYMLFLRKRSIESIVIKTVSKVSVKGIWDVTIYFCNDHVIQKLNKQFRKIDHPTDVLSFPYDEQFKRPGEHYLGDVIISVQKAREQARSLHHTLQDEIQLLVVHGVLHLLGFNHDTSVMKQQMWKIQDSVLKNL